MKRKNHFTIFFALFIAITVFPSLSQINPPQETTSLFRIAEVTYSVSGLTSRPYLEEYLGIKIGEMFDSEEELRSYLLEKERLITGNKVFEASSNVGFEFIDPPEVIPRPVRVIVFTRDSWTTLALPLVKYSTSEGLSFAVRFKDFNFLGRLEPLSLDLDYYSESKTLELGAYFTLFKRMLGSKWALSVGGDLSWPLHEKVSPNGSITLSTRYARLLEDVEWYTSPLLSYGYSRDSNVQTIQGGAETGIASLFGTPWNVALKSYIVYKPETLLPPYLNSDVGASATLKLFQLPFFGSVNLWPSVGFFATNGFDGVSNMDAGPRIGLSAGFGGVDWVGNLRKGASLSIGGNYSYHLITATPKDLYDVTLNLDLSAFTVLSKVLGFDFRFLGRWFGTWTLLGESSGMDWGEYLRGFKNGLYGDLGFVANFQFPVNLAQGRFFDIERLEAEVFIIPFIDAGLIRMNPSSLYFDEGNAVLCSGLDLVVFPLRARAFAYRLSGGYDMTDYLRNGNFDLGKLEVKLGLGLHF